MLKTILALVAITLLIAAFSPPIKNTLFAVGHSVGDQLNRNVPLKMKVEQARQAMSQIQDRIVQFDVDLRELEDSITARKKRVDEADQAIKQQAEIIGQLEGHLATESDPIEISGRKWPRASLAADLQNRRDSLDRFKGRKLADAEGIKSLTARLEKGQTELVRLKELAASKVDEIASLALRGATAELQVSIEGTLDAFRLLPSQYDSSLKGLERHVREAEVRAAHGDDLELVRKPIWAQEAQPQTVVVGK